MVERHTKPFVHYEGAPESRHPLCECLPASGWTKAQLKEWLDGKDIGYAADATKAELLELAGVD